MGDARAASLSEDLAVGSQLTPGSGRKYIYKYTRMFWEEWDFSFYYFI